MILVVTAEPDLNDTLWREMSPSHSEWADSGLGLSLQQSPQGSKHTWDDLEPGELPETPPQKVKFVVYVVGKNTWDKTPNMDNTCDGSAVQMLPEDEDDDPEYRRKKWRFYVARSWEERLVLDHPPAPYVDTLLRPPRIVCKLITDRAGARLTKVDRSMFMQNDCAMDMCQLARKISAGTVFVDFEYVFVQVGIDACIGIKKNMVKESIKWLVYAINKRNSLAIVGILGVTPQFHQLRETKKDTVTYNRNLATAVWEARHLIRMQYLPVHLHFLDGEGGPIQPLEHYFSQIDEYMLAGGLILRGVLFKEIGLIPSDGRF